MVRRTGPEARPRRRTPRAPVGRRGPRTLCGGCGAGRARRSCATGESVTTAVVRALGALAHEAAHARSGPRCACPAPAVLADRSDGTVVRCGPVVAKAHAAGTDTAALSVRLGLAADPGLAGILLTPLVVQPAAGPAVSGAASPYLTELHGRPVTLWPHGEPVDPGDPDTAPWEEAAVLLARLHRARPAPCQPGPGPGPGPGAPDVRATPLVLPAMRGPAKAALAVARMRAARPGDPATAPVLAAWRGLPPWVRDEAPAPAHRAPALCHGDLHLGQLVRHPAPHGAWLLIDVDDSGPGDPAWDLARPAAWYAAGLLPPRSGSASWAPTGPRAAPRYAPTATRGPSWTSRPVP